MKGQLTQKIFDDILDRISKGKSLMTILKSDDMPTRKTFYHFMKQDTERLNNYARACDERADFIFDEMFDIADNKDGDVITLEDGTEIKNNDLVQRAKLQIDTRKWALSKMIPNKYGEKITQDVNIKELPIFPKED